MVYTKFRVECTECYEEAEYECDECSAALCASHSILRAGDSYLFCPACDENFRDAKQRDLWEAEERLWQYKIDMSISYDPSLILSAMPCSDRGQCNYSTDVVWSAWLYLNQK